MFNQSSASGNENAAYGVVFLSEYATYASLISNINFTNGTHGPCSALPTSGTNELNQSGPKDALNLSAANATDSVNATTTIVCLNAIDNGQISYLWNYVNDTAINGTNYSAWDDIGVAANATNAIGNPSFHESLANLTGNPALASTVINETGCNPFFTNATFLNASRCEFFAGNDQTTFLPHGGFYAPNGTWINETTTASPDPWYWHPNETGYLPSDQVYQASIGFVGGIADLVYEVAVSFGGATPIPQVFFVNTGTGANETLTFVFDMTAAWTTAIPGEFYGYANATEGYHAALIAEVGTVSITVSQCYVDASGDTACPNSLGGTTLP